MAPGSREHTSGRIYPHDAQAQVVVRERRSEPEAIRRPAAPGDIVPTAAPEDAVGTGTRADGITPG